MINHYTTTTRNMTQQIKDKFEEVLEELYTHIHHKGTRGLWFFTKLNKMTLPFRYEFTGYKRGTVELVEFHYPIETEADAKMRRRKEDPTRGMTYPQYNEYKVKRG